MRCPHCLSHRGRRTRLRWYDVPLIPLPVRRWRCDHCFRPFWRGLWQRR